MRDYLALLDTYSKRGRDGRDYIALATGEAVRRLEADGAFVWRWVFRHRPAIAAQVALADRGPFASDVVELSRALRNAVAAFEHAAATPIPELSPLADDENFALHLTHRDRVTVKTWPRRRSAGASAQCAAARTRGGDQP